MSRKKDSSKVIRIKSTNTAKYDAVSERKANVIGSRIADARKRNGISLIEFSQNLKAFGISVGDAALSKWEKGMTVPNAYQFMAVCCALGLEDESRYFMDEYRPVLNEEGTKKVAEYRSDLIASGKYKPEPKAKTSINFIDMPVSLYPVSAGAGVFLDENNFEMLRFPESSVPEHAEFGVRVSGDSMEPVYNDGQIVWIQKCDQLSIGEVGIFVYDGEGYLKAYDEQMPDEDNIEQFTDSDGDVRPQRIMVSFNPAYPPRVISPFASFQVIGRVL